MKFLSKLVKKAAFWQGLLVLIASILAARTLIFQSGYFNMHDDLQMMRQLEMEKCFLDGQIPCRWVPDMGYGYGFPLFNFYPPLPYLIGEILRVVGFSFVTVAKLTFALSFLVSGVTMYLLAREFFGGIGGVVSAVFYLWAPYHAVDVYVRGAMNEAWALAWFPLILWMAYKLITEKAKKKGRWLIGLALSWFALLTSHNLMVMIFAPLFSLWCLFFILRQKKWSALSPLISSGVLALGLSAFFTIPAVLEQKFVQVDTLVVGYYEYIAHFATISQLLFSRFWGYGASVWGENDGMPFPAGQIHWVLSLVIGAVIFFSFLRSKKGSFFKDDKSIVFIFVLTGWFAAFMAHVRSTPLWQTLPLFSFVQFPWRFLTVVTLCFSFVAGAVVLLAKGSLRWKLAAILAVGVIWFNWNYFLPEKGKMGPLTDEQKFSGAAWDLQRTAGIFDYLPKGAKENPKAPPVVLAEVLDGEGLVSEGSQGTNWVQFRLEADTDTVVRVSLFDFPGWKAFGDGRELEIFVPEEEKWGRIHLKLSPGVHQIKLYLFDTPIRTFSNYLSFFTWAGLTSYLLVKSTSGKRRRTSGANRGDYS